MVLAESVRLISQGQGLGCERRGRECVHVGDNRPFSTPLSVPLAHSWHTAGHPAKLSQLLIPPAPAPPGPPYRMPDMQGKGIRGEEGLRQKKKKH